ncbi:EAL domain-containing protein [Pseudoalteromonas sp. GB56]
MLIVARLLNYEQLRDSLDKQDFIEAQQRLANVLIRFAQTQQAVLHEWQLARTEQAEFSMYFDAVLDTEQTSKMLTEFGAQFSADYQDIVHLRHCLLCFCEVESSQLLFDEAHRLLKLGIASGQNVFRIQQPEREAKGSTAEELEIAIKNEQFELVMMRAQDALDQTFQYEVNLNIIIGGQAYSRAYFGSVPASLDLDSQLDWKTVRMLFKDKLWLKYPQNLCIQLSEQTLQDEVAYTSILALIASEPGLRQRVTLEFSQHILQRLPAAVLSFCKEAKTIGCLIGLCDVRDADIEPRVLLQSGIQIVKLSNELVYNLENDESTQRQVREISAHLQQFEIELVVEELAHRLPWSLLSSLGVKARLVHE